MRELALCKHAVLQRRLQRPQWVGIPLLQLLAESLPGFPSKLKLLFADRDVMTPPQASHGL